MKTSFLMGPGPRLPLLFMLMIILMMMTDGIVGYSTFKAKIPNGDRIPNPCGSGEIWGGVGHLRQEGMGARNQFGLDFKAAGLTWTKEFCNKDSDGDGRTNGQEVGDPNCVWTPGSKPKVDHHLSHPGICEPVDSTQCKLYNDQFDTDFKESCSRKSLECPAFTEDGIKRKDIRLPQTKIPSKETNYYCMLFDMPSDDKYQLVATTPIINNTGIVHHIIMFGCVIPDEEMDNNYTKKNHVYECGMSPHLRCLNIIGTWTVGSAGDCVNSKAGFRIGTGGYRVGALQVHWNNQEELNDQMDSSGLTIYYTNKIRSYNSAVFMVGQEYLRIPPWAPSTVFESTVPSECTSEMLQRPIYITRAVNHMHYLGKSQRISIYRAGWKVRDLTNDRDYHYDRPKFYHFDPPVEVLPGDEIRTTCVYNSESSNRVTYFGEGTSDEMCYGFITYYPDSGILPTIFASWKSLPRCQRYLPSKNGIIDNCPWIQFLNQSHPETQRTLLNFFFVRNCGYYAKFRECTSNCSDVALQLSQHPCLQGVIGEFVKYKLKASPEGSLLVEVIDRCTPITAGVASVIKQTYIFHATFTFVTARIFIFFFHDKH